MERLTARSKRRRSSPDDNVLNAVNVILNAHEGVKERIYKLGQKELSTESIEELVCCGCDCLHPAVKVKSETLVRQGDLMMAFRSRLKRPPNLGSTLQKHYDVSAIDPSFQGILLSRTGISVVGGRVIVPICISRRTSLLDK